MPYELPRSVGLPRPGDRIGRFVVQEVLREGGMGRVYRAMGEDGAAAAIKVIRAEHAGEREYRRRFQREVRLAQMVVHPHVVPVLDAGVREDLLYMTTPFITGGSLDDRLKERGRLEPADAVALCVQIAAGLDALHYAGVVHRDVKPPNILLDVADRALVADFGIAKYRDASVLTEPGKVIGSAPYMAPEQIRGEEVSAATDVYALGCLAFELLTGKRPFSGRRGAELLWAHLGQEPPNPCVVCPGLPPELAWPLLRALEKDPAARPPTATAFARMLQVSAPGARFLRNRR